MSVKPKCYDCKYRGRVPGSAHSYCNHPKNKQALNDPLMQIAGIFGSVGRTSPVQADTGLNVVGHPTGIRKGWFSWPMNFDPVWLVSCDGFEAEAE